MAWTKTNPPANQTWTKVPGSQDVNPILAGMAMGALGITYALGSINPPTSSWTKVASPANQSWTKTNNPQ